MNATSVSKLLLVVVTTLFVLFLGCHSKVTYDRKSLLINGQRRILISGSIHYPRSTPEVCLQLHFNFQASIVVHVLVCNFFQMCDF